MTTAEELHEQDLHDEFAAVMQEFMAAAVFAQDAIARRAGLNGTDLQALGILVTQGPATPGELAARTGITAGGAITLLVDRLEAAGLAHRSRDDHDRRRVRVTADLERVAERIAPLYAKTGAEWTRYLSTLTHEELSLGLEILRAAVRITRGHLEGPGAKAASTTQDANAT